MTEIVKAFTSNEMHTNITIRGTFEEPLFRASDIAEILEINTIRSSIKDYNDTEKVAVSINTLVDMQNVNFLTERGLYKLLFK